ncbi:MAG: hypothetical protein H0W16_08560 [Actinobacteria bacterium]|nr:hypothetical protein [Actinomycetota bacterium]
MESWRSEDTFVVDQLIRPIANLYRISAGGQPVAFVRQKKFALKEDIRFFADESETTELFRIKARSMLELGGRYDVTAPDGEQIGAVEKVFGRSLLRSTWRLVGVDDRELGVAKERSQLWALVRRAIDLVPYGELIPIVFHFTIDSGDRHLGDFTRRLGIRDTYDLDLTGDTERTIDRRLAIALAVALDALQSR